MILMFFNVTNSKYGICLSTKHKNFTPMKILVYMQMLIICAIQRADIFLRPSIFLSWFNFERKFT